MAGKWRKHKKTATPSGPPPEPDPDHAAVAVLPYLYIGPRSSAAPARALAAGLTHVVSVGCRPEGGGDAAISYHRIALRDQPTEDLATAARLAAEIIDGARAGDPGARVLVHCVAGVSRSPALVACYLMREEGMSLSDALALMVSKRPAVRPNDGFVRQLRALEKEIRGSVSLRVESLPMGAHDRMLLLGVSPGGHSFL